MEYRKLKDLVEINSESITKNYKETIINYLDTSNITNGKIESVVEMNIVDAPSRAKRIVRENDIIYSTVRPNLCHYGILRKTSKNMIVSTGFAVLRCKKEILPEYLYAYITLPSITMKLHAIAETSTSAYPSIKPKHLEDLDIALPAIEIQQNISYILSNIDKKIELNNQINDNLLNLNQILFENYFEKDSKVKQKKVLGDVCNIKYGKGLPTNKILKQGYSVYGGNGIIGFYSEYMYDDSHILISCRGAASGKVLFSRPKSFVTNNSLILECDRKLYYYLKELSLKHPYYQYKTGSAQPQITIENIKKIEISIPNDDELIQFNELSANIENQYFNNIKENEILKQLRDTLLPKLMNGEIDLHKIEI